MTPDPASAGVRTAPHYGLGLSEQRLGASLRNRPREQYVVSSKVGRLLVPNKQPRGVDSEGFVVRDDVLPAAREHSKSVVAVGVFNSGLLPQDRPAPGMTYGYKDAPPDFVAHALAIAEVCEHHGTTLPAIRPDVPTPG